MIIYFLCIKNEQSTIIQDLEAFRKSYISDGLLQMGTTFMGDLESIDFAALMCTGVINDVESAFN
jgi:hypothetical protein